MRILFCTDGSKISFNALRNISGWVKDAVIDIICVIDWSFLPDDINIENDGFTNTCANTADIVLETAEKEALNLNLTIDEKIKSCGSAIEGILEQSAKKDYDLILMGSHGKKGLQKWLGSVSQEIINSSKISNYISKEENKKQSLLLTTDGTKCSNEIIRNIIHKIKLCDKNIYICMVIEDANLLFLDGTIDTNWLMEIDKKQQMFAAQALKDIQQILEENNIKKYETTILSGIPAQKIIDYSKQKNIDLIIMGSRNKSRMDRFLTGSVSKRVLENASSDVWIVRCNN